MIEHETMRGLDSQDEGRPTLLCDYCSDCKSLWISVNDEWVCLSGGVAIEVNPNQQIQSPCDYYEPKEGKSDVG